MDSTATVFIYALVDPRTDEVRYVGRTNDIRRRVKEHCNLALRGRHSHLHCWLRSVLADGVRPIPVELDRVSESNWQEAERRHIARLQGEDLRLANEAVGGYGGLPGEMNNNTHLTFTDVEDILRRRANGERTRQVAVRYGLTDSAVRFIVQGRSWPYPDLCVLREAAQRRASGDNRGSGHHAAKLTESQLPEIDRRYLAGESQRSIAAAFGVSQSRISQVIQRHSFGHIPRSSEVPEERRQKRTDRRGAKSPTRVLTEAQVQAIRMRRFRGASQASLAREFGVSVATVFSVVHGNSWVSTAGPIIPVAKLE